MSINSSETSSFVEESWIQWFCNLTGNHLFCVVDKSFIEDSFNLFGLKQYIPKDYNKALDIILDKLGPQDSDSEDLSRSTTLLYGLIHARYIITIRGLEMMYHKYISRDFGECPRVSCRGQAVLPIGSSDEPKLGGFVKYFCPKCQDVYNCSNSLRHIDGAYFGTTFPGLFFMTYEELVPELCEEIYTPRVFGFRISQTSNSLPKPKSNINLNHPSASTNTSVNQIDTNKFVKIPSNLNLFANTSIDSNCKDESDSRLNPDTINASTSTTPAGTTTNKNLKRDLSNFRIKDNNSSDKIIEDDTLSSITKKAKY